MNKKDIKKVVLAYSGGIHTSIIIPWLKGKLQQLRSNCSIRRCRPGYRHLTDLKKKPLQPVLQSFTFLTLKKNM